MFASEPGDGCGVVEEIALEALRDAGDGEGWSGVGDGGHCWVGGLGVGED